jgi:hypothetical protein
MTTKVIQGQVKRLRATFRDDAGEFVDPTTVALRIKSPPGTITEHVYGTDQLLVRESEGSYYFDILFNSPGLLDWRWVSTGIAASATQGSIEVEAANV